MVRRDIFNFPVVTRNCKSGYVVAEICGANIKPHSTLGKAKKRTLETIKDWGVFVHFRLPDGYQYDAMWDLESSVTTTSSTIPTRKVGKNHPIPTSPGIALALRACGVNEFVELIGTKVKILRVSDHFLVAPINEVNMQWFLPHYYDIIPPANCNEETE